MNGWGVLALVLLILFLLGQIRVGVQGEYTADGLTAGARVGPVRIQIYPFKDKKASKKKKPPKAKKEKPKAETQGKKKGGAVKPLLKLLPLALEAAGQFRRKLQVDILYLEVTAGAPDPADAAMVYGRANAALGAAWQPLNAAFRIKNGRASVRIDFDREQTTVYGAAALSIKVGQALWLALYFGGRALAGLLKIRTEEKQKNNAERRSEPDGK